MITLEGLSEIVENAINNYYYKEGRYDMAVEIADALINAEDDSDACNKINAILLFEIERRNKYNGTK